MSQDIGGQPAGCRLQPTGAQKRSDQGQKVHADQFLIFSEKQFGTPQRRPKGNTQGETNMDVYGRHFRICKLNTCLCHLRCAPPPLLSRRRPLPRLRKAFFISGQQEWFSFVHIGFCPSVEQYRGVLLRSGLKVRHQNLHGFGSLGSKYGFLEFVFSLKTYTPDLVFALEIPGNSRSVSEGH